MCPSTTLLYIIEKVRPMYNFSFSHKYSIYAHLNKGVRTYLDFLRTTRGLATPEIIMYSAISRQANKGVSNVIY